MDSLVITGASSGIGLATAKLAVERGAQVFGSVRRREDAERLRRCLGERFEPLLFDVRDEAAIRTEAARVRDRLRGRTLGGLVSSAATVMPGPVLLQPLSEIWEQIETNLMAAFTLAQAFGPLLGADRSLTGPPGRIVLVTSIGGRIGQPFAGAYIAAKHGLEGLADTLRRELALYGIDVVAVGPSVVDTPIWSKVEPFLGRYTGTDYAEAFDKGLRTMITAGREHGLKPEAVAGTILEALTTSRPSSRYAPAEHPILEQALPRALPRRLLDWAMTLYLGLRGGRGGPGGRG